MSNFQLALTHFNQKSSNYINGATKWRESREYSKHSSNPVCILRRKIATDPYLCVGTFILYPTKIYTKKNWLLQGNADAKMQLPASSAYFASRIYWSAFQLCEMLQILLGGLSAHIQIWQATWSIERKKSVTQLQAWAGKRVTKICLWRWVFFLKKPNKTSHHSS